MVPEPASVSVSASVSDGDATDDRDFLTIPFEELQRVKYDTLRYFLRKKGLNTPGNKADLIKKIASLREPTTAPATEIDASNAST